MGTFFIQMLFKKDSLKVCLRRYYVRSISLDSLRLFHDFTGQKRRHYVSPTLPFVSLGYTWSLNSDLSRYFLLTILLRYIHIFQNSDQRIKQTLSVTQFTVLFMCTLGRSTMI